MHYYYFTCHSSLWKAKNAHTEVSQQPRCVKEGGEEVGRWGVGGRTAVIDLLSSVLSSGAEAARGVHGTVTHLLGSRLQLAPGEVLRLLVHLSTRPSRSETSAIGNRLGELLGSWHVGHLLA